jgi:hypothetical protein
VEAKNLSMGFVRVGKLRTGMHGFLFSHFSEVLAAK